MRSLRSGLSPNPMTPDTQWLHWTVPRGNLSSPRRGPAPGPLYPPSKPQWRFPRKCPGLSLLSAAQLSCPASVHWPATPTPHTTAKAEDYGASPSLAGRAGTLSCEEPKFREEPLLLASVLLTPQTGGPTGGHALGGVSVWSQLDPPNLFSEHPFLLIACHPPPRGGKIVIPRKKPGSKCRRLCPQPHGRLSRESREHSPT